MALSPTFSICQNKCDELTFTDTTGDYDASTNTGGWGAPNTARAAVTSSYINITDPSGATYIIDATTDVVAGTLSICISTTVAGITGDYVDGIYKVEWVVSDASTSYSDIIEVFVFCQAKCKVDTMVSNLDTCDCCCKNKAGNTTADNILTAFLLLKGLESAACCYKITKFNDLLDAINAISEVTCKNC
jgi:hypothetical protein